MKNYRKITLRWSTKKRQPASVCVCVSVVMWFSVVTLNTASVKCVGMFIWWQTFRGPIVHTLVCVCVWNLMCGSDLNQFSLTPAAYLILRRQHIQVHMSNLYAFHFHSSCKYSNIFNVIFILAIKIPKDFIIFVSWIVRENVETEMLYLYLWFKLQKQK